MRFTTVRSVLVGLTLVLFGSIAASAQEPDGKARAKEVLDQARAALGGDKALNAVRSLSGSGDFRSGLGGAEVSGEVQFNLLLPDKFKRIMKWSPTQEMKATRVEAMNGDQVWSDSQMKQPSQMLGNGPTGGGMGRGGGRGGGGMGRSGGGRRSTGGGGGQPGMKGPAPELGDGTDSQQMRLDFSCLMMALLLNPPGSSHAEFSYAGDGVIDGANADFLNIVIGDGSQVRVAIDQKTHRPIMASYKATMTSASGGERSQDEAEKNQPASSEPEASEVQLYFSEYKAIAEKGFRDIWLPYQISKTHNGQTVEDMHIKKFQLNPHLKPTQFERKG